MGKLFGLRVRGQRRGERSRGDRFVLEADAFEQSTLPRRGRNKPESVFSVVVLPAPLAPSKVTSSPLLDCERNALRSAWMAP